MHLFVWTGIKKYGKTFDHLGDPAPGWLAGLWSSRCLMGSWTSEVVSPVCLSWEQLSKGKRGGGNGRAEAPLDSAGAVCSSSLTGTILDQSLRTDSDGHSGMLGNILECWGNILECWGEILECWGTSCEVSLCCDLKKHYKMNQCDGYRRKYY